MAINEGCINCQYHYHRFDFLFPGDDFCMHPDYAQKEFDTLRGFSDKKIECWNLNDEGQCSKYVKTKRINPLIPTWIKIVIIIFFSIFLLRGCIKTCQNIYYPECPDKIECRLYEN